jgi:hypothetical protein
MIKPKQTDAFPVPHYRATFSLPAPLAKDLNEVAKRMGVSQSALLSELLAGPIAAMREVMDQLPAIGASGDDVKRARGKSVDLIRGAVREAMDLVGELGDDGHS